MGTQVRHRVYGIVGIVKVANSVTAFVLWRNGVGTEVGLNSLEIVSE